MNQRVNDLLQHQYGNYILPFFWQHGADEATLRGVYGEDRRLRHQGGLPGGPASPRLYRAEVVAGRRYRDGRGPEAGDEGLDSGRLPFPDRLCQRRVKNAPDHLKRWALLERTMEVNGPLTGWRCEVATRLGYTFMMGR